MAARESRALRAVRHLNVRGRFVDTPYIWQWQRNPIRILGGSGDSPDRWLYWDPCDAALCADEVAQQLSSEVCLSVQTLANASNALRSTTLSFTAAVCRASKDTNLEEGTKRAKPKCGGSRIQRFVRAFWKRDGTECARDVICQRHAGRTLQVPRGPDTATALMVSTRESEVVASCCSVSIIDKKRIIVWHLGDAQHADLLCQEPAKSWK